jgi:hypothetical protein
MHTFATMKTGPLFTLRLRPAETPLDYDLNLLATTAQGLINRDGPRVLVENPISEARSKDVLGTWHWLERLRQPGRWLAEREVVELGGVEDLLLRFEIPGVVVFDPKVPASSNAAVSFAALEGMAVTGPDGLSWLAERQLVPHRVHDMRGFFESKTQPHRWIIEKCIAGRADLRLMSYVMDSWRRHAGGGSDGMDVEGMDLVIAERGIAFDLCPFATEEPVDDPEQPLGLDREVWDALFTAATAACTGDDPLEVTGFPFWKHKYSNHHEAGGHHRPVEAEWEAVWQISRFGAYLNPLIAPNMSFHRWAETPTITQPDPGPLPPLENKTYVCLHLGDFDGGYGVYRRLPRLWSDPRRGELPMGWGINPNLATQYPDLIAEIHATRTPNDHLHADAGAAGYANPNRMAPEALERWARFCEKWYRQLDYTLSPMVLDQQPPTPAVLDAFAKFSPDGAAWLLENRQGEEVSPVTPQLWNGMPVAPLHDLSYAHRDGDFVGLMLSHTENDSPDQPAFHIFRFEWKTPGFVYDTFREAQGRAQREWVAVHPLHWFRLLTKWLGSQR